MVTLTLAFVLLLYMTGLRADRAGTVTEAGVGGVEGIVRQTPALSRRVQTGGENGAAGQEVGLTAPASVTSPGLYRGHTAYYWATKYKRRTRQYQHARARLLSSPSVTEAITLAGATYGNTSLLWALARCESGLSPTAKNLSGSSGLLQFMPSTFASTPYGGMSIWSPYANAMAGGWMLAHGRRSEWVC